MVQKTNTMEMRKLQDVVNMVSLILTDYPVHYKTFREKNTLIITTPIWDFYLSMVDGKGYYYLGEVVVNNAKLADKMTYDKNRITREVFSKHCVSNSL